MLRIRPFVHAPDPGSGNLAPVVEAWDVLRGILKLLGSVVLVVLVMAPAALASTYYVSPNGSNSNSGTSPGQAWRTVDRVDTARLGPSATRGSLAVSCF